MKRLACLSLLLLCTTGCHGLLHELQPHRLHRWNYMKNPGRADAGMYSVTDDLSQPVTGPISPSLPAAPDAVAETL